MRLVFMGTPEFAGPTLEALLRSDEQVVGVVTQPDRPKGRGRTLTPSPIKLIAQRAGLPLLQPVKMKDPAFLDALRGWQPHIIVVAAFGRILPPAVLEIPPQGCVNVHASLLPKYRGAGPIQWALINGERETGVTTMLMDEGMDTGAILLQRPLPIAPDDTAGSLSVKLAHVGATLLLETLGRLQAGTLTPRAQDSSQASLAPLLQKEDGLIDWGQEAVAIANRIRGLTPWPGAYTYFGADRWIVAGASAAPDASGPGEPGRIVSATKEALMVATGRSCLAITALQPANSRRMTVAEYLAGHRIAPGTLLGPCPRPEQKPQA
jgi:methionyl-tRNA formyltransferase